MTFEGAESLVSVADVDITTGYGSFCRLSDTTTSDAIFYQPKPFVGYPHVQGLYAKQDGVWNEKSLLYFLALFKAVAFGRFDYAAKFTRKIAVGMKVLLPITKDGTIDFSYMEKYMETLRTSRLSDLSKYLLTMNKGFEKASGRVLGGGVLEECDWECRMAAGSDEGETLAVVDSVKKYGAKRSKK